MRRPTLITALSAVALLAAACGPRGGGDIPVLDVTASYPEKNIILQDIAEVEYIPLETREGFLVDDVRPKYLDDEIMIISNRTGDIMIFDRQTGRGITSFNRHGRGPGEYPFPYIGKIAVDSEADEIFVALSVAQDGVTYQIYVYDMEGKPLRTIDLGNHKSPGFFHNYDAEHLFFLNNDTSQPEPFNLISKTDTVVTRLPVRFEGRDHMTVTQRDEHSSMFISRGNQIAKTPGGYVISEPGIDTMWRFDKATSGLTPVMTRIPSFASMEYPIGVFFFAEGDDWLIVDTFERRYDFDSGNGFDGMRLICDKRTGEFSEVKILNTDYAPDADVTELPYFLNPKDLTGTTETTDLPDGTLAVGIQPFKLIDLHAAGKLNGRLAEIAATLKEDDNPVMMIVTFK